MKRKERKEVNSILKLLCSKTIFENSELQKIYEKNEYFSLRDFCKELNMPYKRVQYWLWELKQDEYIRLIFFDGENNLKQAFIEEKGRIFINNGGYKWTIESENIALIISAISLIVSMIALKK